MPTPRADFTGTLLLNGKVLLAGGKTDSNADTAYVHLFDPASNGISLAATMNTPRNGHSATRLPDGRVLVAGGASFPTGPALTSAEIYDPVTNSWTNVASMAQPRGHHVAVLLTNGKVYVVGGDGGRAQKNPTTSEVYDPRTNTWTSAEMNYGPRPYGPTVTSLTEGRVMIMGGLELLGPLPAEFYDPATGQATPGRFTPATGQRTFATAAQLIDGTVIVVGGYGYNNFTGPTSTDLYDPSKDNATCLAAGCTAWTAGPPLYSDHCHHTMTTLKNGLLLVVGGQCVPTASVQTSELYDPIAKRWLPTASLQEARGYHVAVLLADGRVMVAGGEQAGGGISITTEIYTPA
jgi:hypothetical protein